MDTNNAEIRYSDKESGLMFVWHGGAYIEVGYQYDAPADVINVWDDEADVSTFEAEVDLEAERNWGLRPFRAILEAFEAQCRQYVAESMVEAE